MLDPVSFSQLGKIRQQEILEAAEHYRDAMTFGEMTSPLFNFLASCWHKLRHLGSTPEPCPEAESIPTMNTEPC